MKLPRLLLALALTGAIAASMQSASALDLPSWSDDRAGADTDPATTVASPNTTDRMVADSSEDGRVVAAVWRDGTSPTYLKGSVGYTDGTAIKWTSVSTISAPSGAGDSAYYHVMSVSGDGRTVYVAWIEQSLPDNKLDDLMVVIGAVSVNPTTKTPSVSWSSPQRFAQTNHQWWPSIDSNYDGTKVVMTAWDLGPTTYLQAHVANVVISGNSRTATWKGPTTAVTLGAVYNGLTIDSSRMALKVNRAGTRAAAAYWFSPSSGGNYNFGTMRIVFGDISDTLAFPSSLSGSAWSGPTSLSGGDARNGVAYDIDVDDAGSKVIVGWYGSAGTNSSDKKWVATRVGTLSNATTATFSPAVKMFETTDDVTDLDVGMSSDGSRVFSSWSYKYANSTVGARVGTDSSGTTTWSTAQTLIPSGGYYYQSADMSRDGTTAVLLAPTGSNSSSPVNAFATNIWSSGGELQTDWNSTSQTLSGSISQAAFQNVFSLVAKDGSVATAVWASSTQVASRTTYLAAPGVTSVSPSSGSPDGGDLVTITGSNFRPGASVSIGGVACTSVTFVSSTQITCTTGASDPGTDDVVVTNQNGQAGTGPALYTYVVPAPLGVTNVSVQAEDGQPRTVTVSFNAPSNAETKTLSGFLIAYRCLTKVTANGPCTGKWRLGSSIELDDDSTKNNELITHTFTLPEGIAGTSGQSVSFRVFPVADDDDMSLGPVTSIGTTLVRDTPLLSVTPLLMKSTANGRIRVMLDPLVIGQTRGSTITSWVVEYTRNNKSWYTVTAPTGGWAPGKSRVVTVSTIDDPYYFRVRVDTNAGLIIQNPPKSHISR